MKKLVENLPIFNGRRISTLLQNGEWYVAIKPICEALGIQYEAQRIRISENKIMSQLPCKHMVVAADGKLREMLCLPERYVYGWLFSISSDSEELIAFQHKCYDLLYDHFHGALTGRAQIIAERAAIDIEIKEIDEKTLDNPDIKRRNELVAQRAYLAKQLSKQVKTYDLNLSSVQGSLFPTPDN